MGQSWSGFLIWCHFEILSWLMVVFLILDQVLKNKHQQQVSMISFGHIWVQISFFAALICFEMQFCLNFFDSIQILFSIIQLVLHLDHLDISYFVFWTISKTTVCFYLSLNPLVESWLLHYEDIYMWVELFLSWFK